LPSNFLLLPPCPTAVSPSLSDTIWQLTLQRQLGVNMYGGSYVVNLLKQKVVSQKKHFLLP